MRRMGHVLAHLAVIGLGLGVVWIGIQASLTYAAAHDPFGFIVGMVVAVVGLALVAVGADATR